MCGIFQVLQKGEAIDECKFTEALQSMSHKSQALPEFSSILFN